MDCRCLLSADNHSKQFGPLMDWTNKVSGPDWSVWVCAGCKLFVTLLVFLKEILEKVNFVKKHAKLPSLQRVIMLIRLI